MLFLGTSFIGDISSYTLAPSDIENIKNITITRGIFDAMSVNTDVIKHNVTDPIPDKWEGATIMQGDFDETTSLGALDLDIDAIDGFIVKRREVSVNNPEHKWLFLMYEDLTGMSYEEKLAAFNTPHFDNTNRSSTMYEYAIVPLTGRDPVTVVPNLIESFFNGVFIADCDETWGTIVTDAFINTTRNIQKSYQTTLNHRYPRMTTAAIVNYDTGSCEGEFVPIDWDECTLNYDDIERNIYQKKFMDFLTNYKAKMLKSMDGRTWLIDVSPSPSDTADGIYYRRKQSFNWTEVGDFNSQSDMYYNRLYNVPERYWSIV